MSILMSFGSNARGDNDKISDIDILKVCDFSNEDTKKMNNIHMYSKKRLNLLKKAESLFLVHLRDEGQIITDESDWLKIFLNNIPNFSASKNQIFLVEKYLTILLSITPTEKQTLWWFDCLYVFLRDYLIKYNSQFNYYSFSPHSFAKLFEEKNNLVLTEDILKIRAFKAKHRKKDVKEAKVDLRYILTLKKKISTSLNIPTLSNNLKTVFLTLDEDIEQYFKLRLIEGLYLNNDLLIADDIILKFIESPQSYNWEINHTNLFSKIEMV